MKLIK
jgi:thymidylate synthase (FAD)